MHDGQSQLTDSIESNGAQRIPSRLFLVATLASVVVLAGCASSGNRAPVVDLSNNPTSMGSAPQPSGSGYVVKPGDTLYKIARANNVEIENLKRWNNLTDPNQLVVGQVLRLSSSGGPVGPSSAVQSVPIRSPGNQPRPLEGSAPLRPAEGNGSLPPPTPLPPLTPSGAPATPPLSSPPLSHPSPAPDAGVIKWGWPASGKVMEAFNANTKGIDIEGAPGDPVLAAADGKVMYAGNGVRGLGNLIIINHQNGFITAYAHNRALLVKTGQEVKRGTKIAEIGQTDAPSPRLHFEVRRQGTPVDPMRYLPPQ